MSVVSSVSDMWAAGSVTCSFVPLTVYSTGIGSLPTLHNPNPYLQVKVYSLLSKFTLHHLDAARALCDQKVHHMLSLVRVWLPAWPSVCLCVDGAIHKLLQYHVAEVASETPELNALMSCLSRVIGYSRWVSSLRGKCPSTLGEQQLPINWIRLAASFCNLHIRTTEWADLNSRPDHTRTTSWYTQTDRQTETETETDRQSR